MSDYVFKVKKIAEEIASKKGIIIEEVEWVLESENHIMRIIADTDEGIDIEQASELNTLIGDELDKLDFISEEYMLEVSSPGVERKLKDDNDIIKNIDSYIHIDFNEYFDITKEIKVKELEGYLRGLENDEILLDFNIKGRVKKLQISKDKIKLIRKAIKF